MLLHINQSLCSLNLLHSTLRNKSFWVLLVQTTLFLRALFTIFFFRGAINGRQVMVTLSWRQVLRVVVRSSPPTWKAVPVGFEASGTNHVGVLANRRRAARAEINLCCPLAQPVPFVFRLVLQALVHFEVLLYYSLVPLPGAFDSGRFRARDSVGYSNTFFVHL